MHDPSAAHAAIALMLSTGCRLTAGGIAALLHDHAGLDAAAGCDGRDAHGLADQILEIR
jgi:hypothetical protein